MTSILKDKVFIFDLHNTLYDEVLEYAGAMNAALDIFQDALNDQKIPTERINLLKQIAKRHAELGSDWDNDVWDIGRDIYQLKNFQSIKENIILNRNNVSKELTQKYTYSDVLKQIRYLKKQGAKVFLATEATANAASDAVRWLGLDGVFDSVYSWAYKKPYQKLLKTPQKFFPLHPLFQNTYLQKPHPYILAEIFFDILKEENHVPKDLSVNDIFENFVDNKMDLSFISSQSHEDTQFVIDSIQTKIRLKNSLYKDCFENLIKNSFYIGDSYFKDGYLALNAGVQFVHAQYGKNIDIENIEEVEKAKELLCKVTGWSPYILQLTQDINKHPQLATFIKPYFVCKTNLQDFIKNI